MISIAQNESADELLTRDPLALLIGMVLDQQQPMERAFLGPYHIAKRLRVKKLSAKKIASIPEEEFVSIASEFPAIHRFPASMAKRIQKLCNIITDEYAGDAANVWVDVQTAEQLYLGLKKLPGFGEDKAKIFIALLGKQLNVRPTNWRKVSDPYGAVGSKMTVADVTSPKTLLQVRAFKQEMKAKGLW